MSRDRKIELLGGIQLFSACTDKELKRIAQLMTEIDVPEGEELTTEGQPGNEAFVIAEGKAVVTLRGEALANLGPGDFFGEMALLDEEPRAATVTAETPMKLYVIGTQEFTALIEEVPIVARKVLRGLAARLRETENAPKY